MMRNPRILGVTLPPLNTILFGGIGFAAPAMVEGFASRFLPAEITASTLGKYALRIASVVGLGWAARQFVGTRESNSVLIGGSIYVAVSALQEFAPGIVPGMGAYVPMAAYVPSTLGHPNAAPALPEAAASGYDSAAMFPPTAESDGIAARFKRF